MPDANPLKAAIDRACVFGVSQSGRLIHHFLYEGLNIDLAGIRLPEIAVPLATFAGWNLRDEKFGAGGTLAGLHGSYLELPHDKSKNGDDSRPSIKELYANHADYFKAYGDAVLRPREDGFLLDRDAVELLREAAARELSGN